MILKYYTRNERYRNMVWCFLSFVASHLPWSPQQGQNPWLTRVVYTQVIYVELFHNAFTSTWYTQLFILPILVMEDASKYFQAQEVRSCSMMLFVLYIGCQTEYKILTQNFIFALNAM